ncbi:25-diketo-D-gluconate reductase [Fusarium acuminatum]|uniref:25-diketo-D-gluconate reductase n=1 Tax=Fusarium acuminatum TaxID=5515 RepID=A0ABZ2WRS2_9HYPO
MGQRTFTLIPQFPGRAVSPDRPPLRPMTSKQVRKEYKAANKGPKLTRAEAWKQEKAEQERIRKEFEREKAAAKAKVVRDKKKEKELAEKEAKRKKRLPLVNVRPSQETISWFVRGNGTTKKRDACGKDVEKTDTTTRDNDDTPEETTSANEDEPEQPATKIQKLDNIQEEDEDSFDTGMGALVQNEPLKLSMESPNDENHQEEGSESIMEQTEQLPTEVTPGLSPPKQSVPEIELEGMEDELDADFEEDFALGILEDIEAAMGKSKPNETHKLETAYASSPKPNSPIPEPLLDDTRKPIPNRYAEDLGLHRPQPVSFDKPPALQKPQSNLKPRSPSPPHQEPPMSTQAILYNLDDFFPSSTQQARELEEDPDDDLMPSAPLHLAPITEEEEFSDEEPEKPGEQNTLPVLDPVLDSPPPRRFFTSSGSHERMCLAVQRSRRTAALEKIQQRERSRVQAGMVQQVQTSSRNAVKPGEPAKKPPTFSKPPAFSKPPLHINQRNQPRQPPFKISPGMHEKPHTNTPPVMRAETPKQPQRPPLNTSPTHNRLNTNTHTPAKVTGTAKQPSPARPQETKENQRPPQEPFALSASQESYGGEWVDDLAYELTV